MIIKTSVINEKLKLGANDFVAQSEKAVNAQIESCAEKILPNVSSKPLILISGPSGSSKTTTAIKLAKALRRHSVKVCYISMDKYFKNFTETEKKLKRQGKIDLESPERVDGEHLSRDIDVLLNGGDIFIPSYDFLTNTRALTDVKLNRGGGFIIVEGIHALNTELMSESDDFSSRIYVSVRTRVTDSQNDRLHPCKIRLLRRIIRDGLYRGRTIEDTVRMFPTVQRGENKYIMPYKSRANFNIDTFLAYEPCIYKRRLYDDLLKISGKYSDIRDVVNALDEIEALDDAIVPPDAFMREFIGGSSLTY